MGFASLFIFALLSTGPSSVCGDHATSSNPAKAVDFCNFTYPAIRNPRSGKRVWPAPHFRLVNGDWHEVPDESGFPAVTLESVEHSSFTGLRSEGVITTLRWHSGGSMQKGLVYVWSLDAEKPRLLWSFAAGDRAYGGLHNVYGKSGDLVVELDDPSAAIGNCCSKRFIRKRYRWNGSRFELAGKPETLPNHEYDNMKE
jgi:hypothetical protein